MMKVSHNVTAFGENGGKIFILKDCSFNRLTQCMGEAGNMPPIVLSYSLKKPRKVIN
jgi:hypothetical protein